MSCSTCVLQDCCTQHVTKTPVRVCLLCVFVCLSVQAGGCYVPLDPNFPADRLSIYLEDSQSLAVVTEQHNMQLAASLIAELPRTPAVLLFEDAADSTSSAEVALPDLSLLQPTDLAYIMFTSGSTGRPKGVMVTHGGVRDLVAFNIERFNLGECQSAHRLRDHTSLHAGPVLVSYSTHGCLAGQQAAAGACTVCSPPDQPAVLCCAVLCPAGSQDVFCLNSTVGFDSYVTYVFASLVIGGRLVVPGPTAHLDPAGMAQLIATHGITTMEAVPALASEYMAAFREAGDKLSCLTRFLTGGEALTPKLAEEIVSTLPGLKQGGLFNSYGPTEVTVTVSVCVSEQQQEQEQ